jgi:hypothetical protein
MKSNSRFNNNKYDNNNNFKPNRFVSKQVNEERNKKQKEDEFIKTLHSSTSFPELQTNKNSPQNNKSNKNNKNSDKNEASETINFMDAMNTVVTKPKENTCENDKTDNVPPPGCVCIKYNETTKEPVWIYGKNTTSISNHNVNLEKEENPYDVFQRVVNLYQSRKYEYIRKWGIDEYDKMFLYQNYDYEYFDKLDYEEIEKNMDNYYQANTYSNNYYDYENNDIDVDN